MGTSRISLDSWVHVQLRTGATCAILNPWRMLARRLEQQMNVALCHISLEVKKNDSPGGEYVQVQTPHAPGCCYPLHVLHVPHVPQSRLGGMDSGPGALGWGAAVIPKFASPGKCPTPPSGVGD